jgi:hypothetical protein
MSERYWLLKFLEKQGQKAYKAIALGNSIVVEGVETVTVRLLL